MVPEARSCTKCKLIKPLSEFSKAPRGKYGRKASCKKCDAVRHAAQFTPKSVDEDAKRKRYTRERGPLKECRKCGTVKDRSEFSKARDGKYGPVLKSYCKCCESAAALQWFRDNAERSAETKRRWNLHKLYGITPEAYDALLAEQGGVCAICKRPERAQRLGRPLQMPVDHCHATGRLRGILCHACNRAIGLLRDDVEVLREAIAYLTSE
jgi:Recombination endonuclease VII